MNQGRLVHITLPKSGSQWVRDVIKAPELLPYSSAPYSGITLDLQFHPLPNLPHKTFSGPIYSMDWWQWQAAREPGDRALVVIRDPRDRLVSEIFSHAYSHDSTPMVDLHREILLRLPSMDDRIYYGIARTAAFRRFYLSWSGCQDESVMLVRYEDLVRDQHAAFSHIVEWLGWEIPGDVLKTVVDRLSFEQRSGRQAGDTDIYSHYRRGVVGDWRNHFHRSHGEIWEDLFSGHLAEIGYEAGTDWWKCLPEPEQRQPDSQSAQIRDEREILRKRNRALTNQNKEKELEIQKQAGEIRTLRDDQHRANATMEEALRTQLEAKELILQEQSKRLHALERVQEQAKKLHTLEDAIARERATTSRLSENLEALEKATASQLEAKEAVIQKQAAVLRTRAFIARALGVNLYKSLRGHAAAAVRPRLGRLRHHPPRQMRPLPNKLKRIGASPLSISVVTPSLNQSEYVERTLGSALDQNYPNLEYWVQDGGSKDRTVQVLESWQEKLTGWQSEPDRGQADALNRGFAKTNGEIMAWLNADDLLLPGALACVADFFFRHPDIDVVYGNRLLIDEDDNEIGCWILPRHDDTVLSWADFVPQETLFWRRRIWEQSGARVDESFRFAMDWDLLVRFRDAGARFFHVDRFLGAFRIHEQQKTSAKMNDVGHVEMNRIRRRCLGRVPSEAEIRRAVAPYMARHVSKDLFYRVIGL